MLLIKTPISLQCVWGLSSSIVGQQRCLNTAQLARQQHSPSTFPCATAHKLHWHISHFFLIIDMVMFRTGPWRLSGRLHG
jgi:hypothetical protein